MKRTIALRTLLVPFALTLIGGGALLLLAASLLGVLSFSASDEPSQPAVDAQPQPTSVPVPLVINTLPPRPTPAPLFSIESLQVICQSNARRLTLFHPNGDPVQAASRILIPPGPGISFAYVIADGRLARLTLGGLGQQLGSVTLIQTEPLNRLAGDVPLQELVDMAYDEPSGALIVLDKSGRVFRYEPENKWALLVPAQLAPNNQADPSYMALAVADQKGHLLDADLNQIWQFSLAGGPVRSIYAGGGPGLSNAVDILTGDRLLILDTAGGLRWFEDDDQRSPSSRAAVGALLPLGLSQRAGQLYVVDGLRRAVFAVNNGDDETGNGFQFVFDEMGLLRDVAFAGEESLLALADNTLIAYPLPPATQTPVECQLPTVLAPPNLEYYGADLLKTLDGFGYPIDSGLLPPTPRSYPGARRLYRAGVHHGLDIHPWDVPGSIDIGEPLLAMQDGIITRADLDYEPITNSEYNLIIDQALKLNVTLPTTLDRIGGRQIIIDHGDGIQTRYLHLDSIADGIEAGVEVKRGEVIGTVGISGTGGEADEVFVVAHAHVEIWIDDHYLGQGLSLRETMWLWQQIFPYIEVIGTS